MEDRAHLEELRDILRGNLEHSEKQAAKYGPLDLPLRLKNQIDETVNELRSVEARLAQLDGTAKAQSVPDHLPRFNQTFVGRKDELRDCLESLQEGYRGWGVIIDGLGGMGKTMLAVEAALRARAAAMFDAYLFCSAKTTWLSPQGVREETLANSSLDAFVREFARQLKLEHVQRMPDSLERRQGLLDALAGRRVLLIWDNLETLIAEERNLIADFLNRLPAPSKAILTSRKRTGESAMTIRLDKMDESEARELIKDLARRNPRLRAELAQSGPLLRDIYVASGGNPLAISWTLGLVDAAGLSLAQALERLRDGQRSSDLYSFLFGALADELRPDDKQALVMLSTFYAPASLAAICDVSGLGQRQAEIALERLVQRSLVSDLENGHYALHPLTRTYVRATLEQPTPIGGDPRLDPAALRRALRYWVDFAQKYGESYETYDRIEAVWTTIEKAANDLHRMALDGEILLDAEAAAMMNELVNSLQIFTNIRGLWEERIHLNTQAYQAMHVMNDWSNAGWRAHDIAFTRYNRGETDQATLWANVAEQAWNHGGTQHDQADGKRLQGLTAEQRGDLDHAAHLYRDALSTYRRLGARLNQAVVLNDLAGIARIRNQYAEAEKYYQQSIDIYEDMGDISNLSVEYSNLGICSLDQDKLITARQSFEHGLKLARQVRHDETTARSLYGLALIDEQEGQLNRALDQAEEALKIRERLHDRDTGYTRELVERLREKLKG
ncbi:MAG TPA: tetratricopeptide repeat protein [Herpetosiphonaceae bacterium]|nr:tetratricopeptide repeat protein [Herpetosiphonaceae bacterium]